MPDGRDGATPILVSKGMWVVSKGAVDRTVRGVIDEGVGIFSGMPAMPLPIP